MENATAAPSRAPPPARNRPVRLVRCAASPRRSRSSTTVFLRSLASSARRLASSLSEAARASAEKRRDALAKSYACRGAVKFGQRLHTEEVEHLVRALERTDVPRLCPHGRPVYLEVTRDRIDDRFERS